MKINKLLKMAATGAALFTLIAGCSSTTTTGSKSDSGDAKKEVRTVKVAFDQGGKPIGYVDEKGNPTGYELEVMKLVDKALPEYKFEYVPTSSEDLLVGVQQGKYQVGVKNAWFTEERTKSYIFPKEFLGLSGVGLLLKKENKDVKDLSDFAKKKLSLAPIAASNAQYTIVDEYNQANPDNKVKLEAGDAFSVDVVQWVNEGRVDGGIYLGATYEKQVLAKDGPYHNLADQVVYNEFTVVKTWPLFNKKEQEFADAYDKAIKKLKEEKKTNDIMVKFYNNDLFKLLDTVKR
ncbi:transporter substrate-binding domain-containing protein [Neobacillus rhizophilus]|uniref:Transporter substrate-binding domain-containing protein n=1 Tax=Neobacillus rhizophilus TaxID=2833579 RepID=A0A942U238_9BACI|nr:transporter substrate-binding domain-containing protein [Neobacillus rhizophilus]MBS4211113.1 transporter substrate-binding domain-containing protein [Neobacillus rhizophilus]MBU8917343.1 transporter substrate-binding domain-containing protein [Bacillus sp. FJAT-29953]